MSKAKTIGSSIWLANNIFQDAEKIGADSRNCPNYLVYSVENLIIAIWESEGISPSVARRQTGNHQLDRMIDLLPDVCAAKPLLSPLSGLTAYATTFRYASPSGKIPKAADVNVVQEWLHQAQAVIEVCARHFQVDVSIEDPVAGHVGPLRASKDHDDFSPR